MFSVGVPGGVQEASHRGLRIMVYVGLECALRRYRDVYVGIRDYAGVRPLGPSGDLFWAGHLRTAAARPPNERVRFVSRP